MPFTTSTQARLVAHIHIHGIPREARNVAFLALDSRSTSASLRAPRFKVWWRRILGTSGYLWVPQTCGVSHRLRSSARTLSLGEILGLSASSWASHYAATGLWICYVSICIHDLVSQRNTMYRYVYPTLDDFPGTSCMVDDWQISTDRNHQ